MLNILIQEDNGGVHWAVFRDWSSRTNLPNDKEFICEGIASTEVEALAAIANDLIGMKEIAA